MIRIYVVLVGTQTKTERRVIGATLLNAQLRFKSIDVRLLHCLNIVCSANCQVCAIDNFSIRVFEETYLVELYM